MPDPISIRSLRDAQRRIREIGAVGGVTDEGLLPNTIETHRIKITSLTQTAGRYPGTVYLFDADTGTSTVLGGSGETGGIWVDTPNGEALALDTYYWARATGIRSTDKRAIFEAIVTPKPGFLGARASRTSAMNANSSSFTTITFQTATHDTGSFWASSPNPERLTIPTAGYYLFNANAQWGTHFTGYHYLDLVGNRAEYGGDGRLCMSAGYSQGSSPEPSQSISFVAHMAVNDYVYMRVYQDTGSTETIGTAGDGNTSLAASFLGP